MSTFLPPTWKAQVSFETIAVEVSSLESRKGDRDRRLALSLLGISVLAALLFTAVPAGATVTFSEEDVTGFVYPCDTTSFTAQSGTIKIVQHEGVAANGNTNFTVTATPHNVVLLGEDGKTYYLRGALWFGGTLNANTGLEQFTFTGRNQIVTRGGGTVGTINLVFHLSPNGTVKGPQLR